MVGSWSCKCATTPRAYPLNVTPHSCSLGVPNFLIIKKKLSLKPSHFDDQGQKQRREDQPLLLYHPRTRQRCLGQIIVLISMHLVQAEWSGETFFVLSCIPPLKPSPPPARRLLTSSLTLRWLFTPIRALCPLPDDA